MSLRDRMRDESGLTIAVVMGALLVLALLSTAIATEAANQNRNAVNDRASKRALGAASAALQVARYRLNTNAPVDTWCMESKPTGPWSVSPTGSNCPGPTNPPQDESLGNGATMKYVVGAASPAPTSCGAARTIPTGARCATAIGTAGGQTRRLQTLLARERKFVLFGVAGVIARGSVSASNATVIATDVGANTSVSVTNSSTVQGTAYTPSLTVSNGGIVTGNQAPIPGTGSFQFPIPDIDSSAVAPSVGYDPVTKSINLAGSTTVTLPAGIYVVCGITLGNSAQLQLAAGAAVQIYVDSPTRTGSTCPAGSTGKVNLSQLAKVNAQSGYGADKLDVFVMGNSTNGSTTDVDMGQSTTFNGTIYAPQSSVLVEQSARVDGAIAGYNVTFQNTSNLTFPASLRTKEYPLPGRFQVTGWMECRPTPSNPNDISSNC